MILGCLHVEAGGLRVHRFGRWIPDGLHVWVGRFGVHLYWHHSPHQRRLIFDRLEVD